MARQPQQNDFPFNRCLLVHTLKQNSLPHHLYHPRAVGSLGMEVFAAPSQKAQALQKIDVCICTATINKQKQKFDSKHWKDSNTAANAQHYRVEGEIQKCGGVVKLQELALPLG